MTGAVGSGAVVSVLPGGIEVGALVAVVATVDSVVVVGGPVGVVVVVVVVVDDDVVVVG